MVQTSKVKDSKLINKNFVDALIANNNYAQNPANQKALKANWNKILKNYKADQKRMNDIRKEANRHKGAWKVIFGVGAVVIIGVVAIVATAGKVYKACGNGAEVEGVSNSAEGGSSTDKVLDYSKQFDRELLNFNDGYEIKNVVDEDMILVQYSSDVPNASLKYWTTVDEANNITTIEEYMDKLAR